MPNNEKPADQAQSLDDEATFTRREPGEGEAPERLLPGLMLLKASSDWLVGKLFSLQGRTVLGRGPAGVDVPLDDGEVSRRHTASEAGVDGVRAEDLESRNGTFVDGRRLESRTPSPPGSLKTWRH